MWGHEIFEFWAHRHPEAEMAVHDGVTTTYGDAAARVDRMAGAFARDLAPGDRFAVLAKNSVDLLLVYLAAFKAGVVPVPLNYRLAPPEWRYIVNDSASRLLLAESEFVDGVDAIAADLPALQLKVAWSEQPAEKWVALSDWLGDPLSSETSFERRVDDCIQMYTSGTTGRPKGAVLTHQALHATMSQWGLTLPLRFGERMLLATPIYHVAGILIGMHILARGASAWIFTDFDAAEVVRVLDEERIVQTLLVPAMMQACLAVDGVDDRKFEHLRLFAYGASPIAEATLRRALTVFGCEFVQSFGMTECNNLTYLWPADHRRALAGEPGLLLSTGRAGPGSAIKIVDDDGNDAPPGVVGEIWGRGPQMMRGYWNLPEASADALAGGWMHTGDAGYIDENGYLYVKDRVKDMISSGAENVYPREVENVLFEHPAVADVAVIGVPSEQWGETVKAIVVRKAGATVTDTELIDFCRGQLAGFKRPRSVDFVEEIPRNPSGKVLKRVLREPYWEGHGRYVG
ncbi:MAG: long-chain-fatty-acid--CoA ligase [Acidimicrobiia bacterium]